VEIKGQRNWLFFLEMIGVVTTSFDKYACPFHSYELDYHYSKFHFAYSPLPYGIPIIQKHTPSHLEGFWTLMSNGKGENQVKIENNVLSRPSVTWQQLQFPCLIHNMTTTVSYKKLTFCIIYVTVITIIKRSEDKGLLLIRYYRDLNTEIWIQRPMGLLHIYRTTEQPCVQILDVSGFRIRTVCGCKTKNSQMHVLIFNLSDVRCYLVATKRLHNKVWLYSDCLVNSRCLTEPFVWWTSTCP
jgi:hypothetical protein